MNMYALKKQLYMHEKFEKYALKNKEMWTRKKNLINI